MMECLAEIGVDVSIPERFDEFKSFNSGSVILAGGDVDFELAQFATLASWGVAGSTSSPQLAAAARQILEEHGLADLVSPADLTAIGA